MRLHCTSMTLTCGADPGNPRSNRLPNTQGKRRNVIDSHARFYNRLQRGIVLQENVYFMKPSRLSCSMAAVAVLGSSTPSVRAQDEAGSPPYRNPKLSVEQRVEDLLARMSLEEKVDMLGGTGFDSKPNARLGIPAIKMADGPQGVRINVPHPPHSHGPGAPGPEFFEKLQAIAVPATAFPAGDALAATWNPDLIRQVGQTIGQEARTLNKDMMLAPCVNIQRAPQGGRNFESYGEDPYLASRIAVAYIK